MLKEKINKDYFEAIKAKNVVAKNLLSVIKGDILNEEKKYKIDNLSDTEVIKILSKCAKDLKELVEQTNDKESSEQLEIVMTYLPVQMTKDEIKTKVNSILESGISNIGGIMKEFATLHADKKIVQEIAKELMK